MANYQPAGSLLPQNVWDAVSELGPNSPVTGWDDGVLSATTTLVVPWSWQLDILNDIVSFRLPFPYLNLPQMLCVGASVVPFGTKSTPNVPHGLDYELAKLTLSWRTVETEGNDPETATLFTETVTPTAEYLLLDAGKFQWSSTQDALTGGEAPGKAIRGLEYTQTRYFLNSIPSEVFDLHETCNSTAITIPSISRVFAPQTLMFVEPTWSRSFETGSLPTWTLTTKFLWRESGWNNFWRADTQSWESIQVKDSGANYNNVPVAAWNNNLIVGAVA